jgi:hypothetical protein
MLLDACTTFCVSLREVFGPEVAQWGSFLGLVALGWWKARKVQAAASAGIAAANEQASKAKAEARSAQVQLARIEGSLRPSSAYTIPPPHSGQSGHFEPVRMPELGEGVPKPRPSMRDPSLVDPTFPRPSAVPVVDEDPPTNPDRPNARG